MIIDRDRWTFRKIVDEIFDPRGVNDYAKSKLSVLSSMSDLITRMCLSAGISVCTLQSVKVSRQSQTAAVTSAPTRGLIDG